MVCECVRVCVRMCECVCVHVSVSCSVFSGVVGVFGEVVVGACRSLLHCQLPAG